MIDRWRAIKQLVLARLRAFFREPGTLFWSIVFPLVLSVALGVAFRNRPPDPIFVAVEQGPTAESLRQQLASNTDLSVRVVDASTGQQLLRTGGVSLVVVASEPVVYRYDVTRPESRVARYAVQSVLQGISGQKAVRDEKVTAVGSRYIDFLLPGLIGMNLMSGGLWAVGFAIADMRSRKLLKRMLATPMHRSDFLLSFLLTRLTFLLLEMPVLLLLGRFLFGIHITGSWLALCVIGVLGSLAFASIGLLCGSRAQNTQTAVGLVNLVSMPMYLLSGVFFSSARFPERVQPLIRSLPLTALNDGLRAVINDGAGLSSLVGQLSVLIVWTLIPFVLALRLFRWST